MLVPAAFWLGRTAVEQIILLGSLIFVLSAELCNTAIESVVDRISDEQHPLSGQAKDLGSSAVFLSLIIAGIIWISSIYRYFFGSPGLFS